MNDTELIIALVISNLAVWILVICSIRAWQIAKKSSDSAYKVIREYKDLMDENFNLREMSKMLDSKYTYLYDQYRSLQKKHDALIADYIEKTGEEPKE